MEPNNYGRVVYSTLLTKELKRLRNARDEQQSL